MREKYYNGDYYLSQYITTKWLLSSYGIFLFSSSSYLIILIKERNLNCNFSLILKRKILEPTTSQINVRDLVFLLGW